MLLVVVRCLHFVLFAASVFIIGCICCLFVMFARVAFACCCRVHFFALLDCELCDVFLLLWFCLLVCLWARVLHCYCFCCFLNCSWARLVCDFFLNLLWILLNSFANSFANFVVNNFVNSCANLLAQS